MRTMTRDDAIGTIRLDDLAPGSPQHALCRLVRAVDMLQTLKAHGPADIGLRGTRAAGFRDVVGGIENELSTAVKEPVPWIIEHDDGRRCLVRAAG